MRQVQAIIAMVVCASMPCTAAAQTLLCERENLTVYYVVNRTEQAADYDEWRIYVDIENRGTEDLYYKIRADKGPDLNQLIPSYLTINVLNAIHTYSGKPFFVHGAPTLQITRDTTAIYKVGTKRFSKHITTRTKKGEEPRLTGEFTSALLPLEQIKALRISK